MHKSRAWVVAAVAVAAFCPLVKPSGSIVLALITIFWSGGALVSILRSGVQDRFASVRFWLFGTIVIFVLGGAVSWMCLHSQYLTVVETYYKQAIVILQNEFGKSLTYPIFQSAMYSIFGPQIIIMLILGGFLIFKRPNDCRFQPPTWVLLLASILFCLVGGWFWIFTSGFQVRLFFPFALMFTVPLVIISLRKIAYCDIALPAFALWGLRMACIIPALNLMCLLLVQNPNDQWQSISGVSMNIGSGRAGVQIANNLLEELTNTNKSAVVYSTNMTTESSSFNCYGYYQHIVHPSSLSFTSVFPTDWQRPSTYRICEILKSDYILFKPISNSQQEKAFSINSINSLGDEEFVFEAFFSTLKPENGLLTMFENHFCRLSKITDKSRFKDALGSFLKTKSWRPVFLEANEVFFQDKLGIQNNVQ